MALSTEPISVLSPSGSIKEEVRNRASEVGWEMQSIGGELGVALRVMIPSEGLREELLSQGFTSYSSHSTPYSHCPKCREWPECLWLVDFMSWFIWWMSRSVGRRVSLRWWHRAEEGGELTCNSKEDRNHSTDLRLDWCPCRCSAWTGDCGGTYPIPQDLKRATADTRSQATPSKSAFVLSYFWYFLLPTTLKTID